MADVLLIHGLMGDCTETWTANGENGGQPVFWPNWLCSDLEGVNCYVLGYPSSVFEKWAAKEMTLYERSKSILAYLVAQGLGERPLVLITHSLGGLLAKQILRTAAASSNEDWTRISNAIRIVVFLATPHTGASLARSLKVAAPRFSGPYITALANETGYLDELNEHYRVLAIKKPIVTLSYYEKFKIKGSLIVDKQSADPGIPDSMTVPTDADHVTICKFRANSDPVYLSIVHHIRKHLVDPDSDAKYTASTTEDEALPSDRRDLLTKLIDGNREHEYRLANELQNGFAQKYHRLGLHTPERQRTDGLLADIQQRFTLHVYHPLICMSAADTDVRDAIQKKVVDPTSKIHKVDTMTVYRAIYYLTEKCFISWNA